MDPSVTMLVGERTLTAAANSGRKQRRRTAVAEGATRLGAPPPGSSCTIDTCTGV